MQSTVTPEGDFCFSAMAGEFPGAPSVDALWHLLAQGQIAPLNSMLPRWELDKASIYSATVGEKNRTYLDSAYCLSDSAATPSRYEGRQVAIGRKVLQALLAQLTAQGSALIRERTALVVATSWSDESFFLAPTSTEARAPQGYAPGEQVAELALALGLGGPALSVDTACSSFPYALNMAQALVNSGQADNAIVMALNTVLPLPLFLGFSQLTAFSPRARMQAFGRDADGIVPGECAVAFLVEPVSQALQAQRRPLGILRALGLSADGAEGSVFAPGKQAQYTAYQRAYLGLDPGAVDYIETHGTGTPLGDATELDSLNSFFGAYRTEGKKLPIGSIKSVIGHPLAAAGGASLAKTLMILAQKTIPPQPDYSPSAKVDESCLQLASGQGQPLADRQSAIRIGISSFGFGGANAHLVVDQYLPGNQPMASRVSPGVLLLDLGIVEAEAAIGSHFSLHSLKQQLDQPAAPLVGFPHGRFVDYPATSVQPLPGRFLAQDHVIDIDGFGMGPKLLASVDPFKLLITDRVNHLLRRLPGVAGSPETAMVMCCNLGGAHFSNAYSRIHNFFGRAQGMPPEQDAADVATSLPSMLSGYPAKIFDLKGFHQTLVGTPGVFWHALLASQQWFNEGITTLLLGAGRFISAPAEIERVRQSPTLQGEGMGVFALRPYRAQTSDTPVLVIRAAVLGHVATSLEAACARLGRARSDVQHIEVCELQPTAAPVGGSWQAMTGCLAEATGVETLLAVMMSASVHSVIEVRQAGKPVMWLFTEKLREWGITAPECPPAIKRPFELRFAHPQPQALQSFIGPDRPASPVVDLQNDETGALALSDQLTETLLSALRVRVRAIEALCALRRDAHARPAEHWQRSPENIVISNVQRSAQSLHAQLLVNEAHRYFFDHPLDHVPGILLIEGVLQLTELAMPPRSGRVAYVNDLTIKFQRYVQKQGAIDLQLEYDQELQVFRAKVRQAGKLMCTCTLGIAYSSAHEALPAAPFTATACRDKALLHKDRQENVLVSDMSDVARGLSVETLQPANEHFFRKGGPKHYSMVYFLEVARQCFMQIAHTHRRIPLGTPMNLLALSFTLDRPIPTNSPLLLAPQGSFEAPEPSFKTNQVCIDLFNRGEKIGQADITAQLLSRAHAGA